MILILNFGGQFCHLIARRIRELGVHSEIVPFTIDINSLKSKNPKGIVLSGGPKSVFASDAPLPDPNIFSLGIPILGICYGFQLIAKFLNGKVNSTKEYGKKELQLVENGGDLLKGLKDGNVVWMSHSDAVSYLPKSFCVLAKTDSCEIVAAEDVQNKCYGVQFHPEVYHTENGILILKNFVFEICKSDQDWNLKIQLQQLIEEVKQKVGNDAVIMGVSGGVDSTVAATIIHHAIGDKLHCVFIDHGLLRYNEREEVCRFFKEELKLGHFYCIDASKLFLSKLKGITDP